MMISGTITDLSGRTLSGQTPTAFWHSVRHARPLTIGLNCALGAAAMREHLAEISGVADTFVCAYPNAGLPNAFGQYDESPEEMAAADRRLRAATAWSMSSAAAAARRRRISAPSPRPCAASRRARFPTIAPQMRLSGLEPFTLTPDIPFVNVGERTNVTGSAKFRKLITAGDYAGALAVARDQVANGAQILDINMDEGLIDSASAMVEFLNLIAAEPDIARVPVMIDSSKFSVIEAGPQMRAGQADRQLDLDEGGRGAVPAHRRGSCARYGAAVVVMAFDEQGQADTLRAQGRDLRARLQAADRGGRLPARGHRLRSQHLRGRHRHRGAQRLRRRLHRGDADDQTNLPHAHISGGVSNLSFSFRGNEPVREAMHAVFLYHAIHAGMDMGIVNAGQLAVYETIDPELREACEDVVLNRRADATERLLALAERYRGGAAREGKAQD